MIQTDQCIFSEYTSKLSYPEDFEELLPWYKLIVSCSGKKE